MENVSGKWLPIVDYAVQKGISTSTLRRYIKAKRIQYKIENGRYLLLDDRALDNHQEFADTSQPGSLSAFTRVRELEEKLVKAQEQISELKMLVAIYEEKLAHSVL